MPEREYLSLMGGELWIERASPWIAVADRLPPDSLPVLAAFPCQNGLIARVVFFDPDLGWVIGGGIRTQVTPSHWMPIPPIPVPPPKETA